jgi:hypothetical protein
VTKSDHGDSDSDTDSDSGKSKKKRKEKRKKSRANRDDSETDSDCGKSRKRRKEKRRRVRSNRDDSDSSMERDSGKSKKKKKERRKRSEHIDSDSSRDSYSGSDGDERGKNADSKWDSPLPTVKNNLANIGTIMSRTVKEKVWAGGYIDLMHFIPQGEKEEKDDKSLRIVGDRLITKKSEIKIQNIYEWTTAFMWYMKIYLQKQKGKMFQMLDYAEDIRFAATKWSGYRWRVYDEQFRVIMDSSPNTRWDAINQRLWLLHITPTTTSASTSFSGNANGKNRFQGGGSGPRPSGSDGKAKGGKTCWAFNKAGCVRGKKCQFEHKCECGEYGHSKHNCPKNKK